MKPSPAPGRVGDSHPSSGPPAPEPWHEYRRDDTSTIERAGKDSFRPWFTLVPGSGPSGDVGKDLPVTGHLRLFSGESSGSSLRSVPGVRSRRDRPRREASAEKTDFDGKKVWEPGFRTFGSAPTGVLGRGPGAVGLGRGWVGEGEEGRVHNGDGPEGGAPRRSPQPGGWRDLVRRTQDERTGEEPTLRGTKRSGTGGGVVPETHGREDGVTGERVGTCMTGDGQGCRWLGGPKRSTALG